MENIKKNVSTQKSKKIDPRPDLTQDHTLWMDVLNIAKRTNIEIYGILHGLRCGGSTLTMGDYILNFQFSQEFSSDFKNHIKQKYIQPNIKVIKKVLTMARQRRV